MNKYVKYYLLRWGVKLFNVVHYDLFPSRLLIGY